MRKEIVKQLLSNYSNIRKEIRSWDGCFIDTSDNFGDYEFLPNLKDGLRKFNTENYSFTVSHSNNDGLIIEIVVDDDCYCICNLPRCGYDYGVSDEWLIDSAFYNTFWPKRVLSGLTRFKKQFLKNEEE